MRALFIPMVSMRSYKTGAYTLLKDGNLQLMMARITHAPIAAGSFLALPHDAEDTEEFIRHFKLAELGIQVMLFNYGKNAADTRKNFWMLNEFAVLKLEELVDVVVVDQIHSYPGKKPVIYNFNITKLPELDRPYVDCFFEQELKSMQSAAFSTVLNPAQRSHILSQCPDLVNTVFTYTKCASAQLLPRVDNVIPLDENCIFWPFRLSDSAYKFTEVLELFDADEELRTKYKIVVTDPNESLKIDRPYLVKIKLTKDEYYALLNTKPTVIMLDDIDLVLHPGTIEFFHYGCPVITLASKLIDNPNAINSLADLPAKIKSDLKQLTALESEWLVHRFVLGSTELCLIYSEQFIKGLIEENDKIYRP